MENIYHIVNRTEWEIPEHWVLTVRTCSCGSRLWWDNKDNTWHCMKESCNENKSHVKKSTVSYQNVDEILRLFEVLTIHEIADKLKLSDKEVLHVLQENGVC